MRVETCFGSDSRRVFHALDEPVSELDKRLLLVIHRVDVRLLCLPGGRPTWVPGSKPRSGVDLNSGALRSRSLLCGLARGDHNCTPRVAFFLFIISSASWRDVTPLFRELFMPLSYPVASHYGSARGIDSACLRFSISGLLSQQFRHEARSDSVQEHFVTRGSRC